MRVVCGMCACVHVCVWVCVCVCVCVHVKCDGGTGTDCKKEVASGGKKIKSKGGMEKSK